MQAVVIARQGGPEAIAVRDVPEPPAPGPNEIQLQVAAAGLNPNDAKLRRGAVALAPGRRYPYVAGREAAGEIIQRGARVELLEVGESVFGFFGWRAQPGGHAERLNAPASLFVRRPASVSAREAAGIGLSGTTAHQALSALDPEAGSYVLVNGAGGGVGSVATQLAVARGCHVVALAGASKRTFVSSLGAQLVIDYASNDALTRLRPVAGRIDYVIDAAGIGSLAAFAGILPANARIAEVAGACGLTSRHRFTVIAQPSAEDLGVLAATMTDDELRCHVSAVFGFSKAASAHRILERGHTLGKIVLVPDP